MKASVIIAALFTTVAMGQMVKVVRRQDDGATDVQNAVMTNAQGEVVPFDSNNVYKAATANGLK